MHLRGFTDRVSRVCPYPLAFCKKGVMFFCKPCLFPCSGVVCTTSVTIGKINDLQIRE